MLQLIWDDFTAPMRVRVNRWMRARRRAKADRPHRPCKLEADPGPNLYFSEQEWKDAPASQLVAEFHDKLGRIVKDAERRFGG